MQIKEAEQEKVVEEKKYKSQITQQDQNIKQLQHDLTLVNLQIKEKDQEYRLNELKIRELRRQVPARVLKPLDAKNNKITDKKPPGLPKAPKDKKAEAGLPGNPDLELINEEENKEEPG